MTVKRIFIAVDISEHARQLVSDWIAGLRSGFPAIRVGWERPEKLHLTIKFLGEIDEARMKTLIEKVTTVAARIPPFTLQISDPGVFPSSKKARVLWRDISDQTGSLTKLSELIDDGCSAIGFPTEKRDFKAHLTIGRLREPRSGSKSLVEKHIQTYFEPVEFEVSEIVIYESKLQPTGSVYSKLATFPLTGNG